MQTHGFHILEGTAEEDKTNLSSRSQPDVHMPDDEIAWEIVEAPGPAPATAAASSLTAGDSCEPSRHHACSIL